MTYSVTINGTSYNDGTAPPNNMADGGFRTYLLPMLSDMMTEFSNLGGRAIATSTSSNSIGSGSKSFTLNATGKSFAVGGWVVAYETATPTNYMVGQVTAFSGTSLTISVASTDTGGSGTITAWAVIASGKPGPAANTALITPSTSAAAPGLSISGDSNTGISCSCKPVHWVSLVGITGVGFPVPVNLFTGFLWLGSQL